MQKTAREPAYGMPDLGSAKQTGWSGCSLSLFARYRADPTADCAGVFVTRTQRDKRDEKDTEPANVLRQVVRTLIKPQRSQIIEIVRKR